LTGAFSWTPSGLSTSQVIVSVVDNGSPALSATASFNVYVVQGGANTAPTLGALSDQNIVIGDTVSFTVTATDPESPPQTLTYLLDPGTPAGASLNPDTGLFTWTPAEPTTNQFTVRVRDSGTPPLETSGSFWVNVAPLRQEIVVSTDGSEIVISCKVVAGKHYKLEFQQNLESNGTWQEVSGYGDITAATDRITINLGKAAISQFYRLRQL